ncbi:zinc finger domain-containing protein [Micromonospora chalcea]|uniref:zinc finger domain-containing protein n=1 Tax=Micromonospora TaxID=1873 RepID=UPI003B985A0F
MFLPCPVCDSVPGERCINVPGHPLANTTLHPQRVQLAERALRGEVPLPSSLA